VQAVAEPAPVPAEPAVVASPPVIAPPAVATPAAPVIDPIITAIVDRLKKPVSGLDKDDIAALTAFYANRSAPLLAAANGWTVTGDAVTAELARADDWGLSAKAYAAARPASAGPEAIAEAEIALAAATLKYARHASGGRVDPSTLSRYNDLRGTFAEPQDVLVGLAATGKPSGFLVSLHPQHAQYQKLHLALVKLRHGGPPAPEAAQPVLPPFPANGPVLKAGSAHKDVAVIRTRLAVAGVASSETYDDAVAAAVKAFQAANGLKSTGSVNKETRAALAGAEPRKRTAEPARDIERIAINMERWRWMPRDLGQFHILNNVPEFATRVVKNGQSIYQERIIVGKTNTPTPVFSANMQFVIFHPEWGVPDSIKVKEIWPSLRRKSGDDFFGFGGSDTRILQRHNMRVAYNGQVVDASKIDWSTADPRRYSFIQSAGSSNVLGVVKFRYPNRHDVYMHDTPERSLFQNAVRSYSHGCVRVNNPRRLAEVILAEAESPGWTPERVGAAIAGKGTQDIKIDRPFPVHTVYLTARVDEATGKLETFSDLYGQDVKLTAAMSGKPVSLEPVETKSDVAQTVSQQINRNKKPKQEAESLESIFSGFFAN